MGTVEYQALARALGRDKNQISRSQVMVTRMYYSTAGKTTVAMFARIFQG
jgi:hypothetical protein